MEKVFPAIFQRSIGGKAKDEEHFFGHHKCILIHLIALHHINQYVMWIGMLSEPHSSSSSPAFALETFWLLSVAASSLGLLLLFVIGEDRHSRRLSSPCDDKRAQLKYDFDWNEEIKFIPRDVFAYLPSLNNRAMNHKQMCLQRHTRDGGEVLLRS